MLNKELSIKRKMARESVLVPRNVVERFIPSIYQIGREKLIAKQQNNM
jgi:hypothetical protein